MIDFKRLGMDRELANRAGAHLMSPPTGKVGPTWEARLPTTPGHWLWADSRGAEPIYVRTFFHDRGEHLVISAYGDTFTHWDWIEEMGAVGYWSSIEVAEWAECGEYHGE